MAWSYIFSFFFSRRLKTYFIIYYDTHTGTRKKEGGSAFGKR